MILNLILLSIFEFIFDNICLYLMPTNWAALIHPILTGLFAFSATCIGGHFFKGSNPWHIIAIGLVLFILANQFMLKFQFNSYQLNGATITTIVVFLSQTIFMTIWKSDQITLRWLFGAAMILTGSLLVKAGNTEDSPKQQKQCKTSTKASSEKTD